MTESMSLLMDIGLVLGVTTSAIAVVNGVMGWLNICTARRNARQQATLGFMSEYNDSEKVSEGMRVIDAVNDGIKKIEASNSSEGVITELVKECIYPNNTKGQERESILFVLNEFEILAIGLKQKIYDPRMVKDFLGRDVREFYNSAAPIIGYIRKYENNPRAFEEFEKLATHHSIKRSPAL